MKGGSVVGMSSVGLWDEEKILTRTEVFRGSVGKRMIVGVAQSVKVFQVSLRSSCYPRLFPNCGGFKERRVWETIFWLQCAGWMWWEHLETEVPW